MVEEENSIKGSISKDVIRKYRMTPMALYRIKDLYLEVTTNPNFLDAVLMVAALIAFASAFPFYPMIALVVLIIILFTFTLRHAFLGLCLLMVMAIPMLMYQAPSLGYVFLILMTVGLVFGYRHYRVFTFAAILLPLALSPLGSFLAIPVLIIGVLVVGYRRAIPLALIFVIGVVMLSAVTGVQNSAWISYNAFIAHKAVSSTPAIYNYSSPHNKPQLGLTDFGSGISTAISNMQNGQVIFYMYSEFGALFGALGIQPIQYLLDLVGICILVMLIDTAAVASRSFYKGTEASLIGIAYPLLYFGISIFYNNSYIYNNSYYTYILPIGSALIAPAFIYCLELYRIDIVKALDVRKEDLRRKFGEAFEDLLASSPTEKFSDIGNYEATKKELKEAIVSPIEEKAVSRAYNIKPVRGVLLFGPPGTGKTMLMRAIAKDIHAGFFLVKTPDLISAYPGETERRLSNIFAVATKNAPCILFFDEIDAMTRSRSQGNVDETHRQVLSQLLVEMDGFQKLKSVVVVGATNVPNLIDPAVLRPGRFDKAIYMPLPDVAGRKEIFRIYLKRLPVSKNVKIDELAKMTERFSGADIKALCDSVAQQVAQEAASKHKVLEIMQEDLVSTIKATKASTSLSQLKEYDRFKIDFERRSLKQEMVEKKVKVTMEDVIGLDNVKKAIVDAVKVPLEHPEMVKKYNVKPIKGILMFGPPGNGKTMLMRAISNNLSGVTMLEISGADLAQEDIGRAVAGIKEIFNRAIENSPSVLFIDELDGIAPMRKGAEQKDVQLTAEFLEEMDGLRESPGVVLVCATNRPSALDSAILRPGRFDKLIFVEPPTQENRQEMFMNMLSDIPSETIDFVRLAKMTEGYTGADIANICREAKTKALNVSIKTGAEAPVNMNDLSEIIKRVKPSAPEALVRSYQSFLDKYGER